jgi:lysozyme family protein
VEKSLKSNFDICFKELMKSEGGWVNNPSDPGGETIWGVTKAVWEECTGRPIHSMKELTQEDVKPLYQVKYWDTIRGNELPSGLDYCVFDCAVNSGVGRSVKFLQSIIGVTADGAIGNNTMAALSQFKDTKSLIEEFSAKRLEFLQALKTFPVFGKGWTKRVQEVKDKALSLI